MQSIEKTNKIKNNVYIGLHTIFGNQTIFNLDDSGISVPVFPSRTNLKLHNNSITPKIVKKVITNLILQRPVYSSGDSKEL